MLRVNPEYALKLHDDTIKMDAQITRQKEARKRILALAIQNQGNKRQNKKEIKL